MHPRYIEASLRKVVRALEVASINDRKRKVKTVRHLSERLLHSRLKMLKARISLLKEFNVFDNTYE